MTILKPRRRNAHAPFSLDFFFFFFSFSLLPCSQVNWAKVGVDRVPGVGLAGFAAGVISCIQMGRMRGENLG